MFWLRKGLRYFPPTPAHGCKTIKKCRAVSPAGEGQLILYECPDGRWVKWGTDTDLAGDIHEYYLLIHAVEALIEFIRKKPYYLPPSSLHKYVHSVSDHETLKKWLWENLG